MSNPSIGVVLTSYKRPKTLWPQLHALRAQTVPYEELLIWGNEEHCLDLVHHPKLGDGVCLDLNSNESTIACSKNWGVWPRFAMAQFMEVDYVAVFDDDTIPGKRWFQNCLDTIARTGPALLGSCGVSFKDGKRDEPVFLGWKWPLEQAVFSDIVGHAWFFPRGLLRNIGFAPFLDWPTFGEDYWLSVEAQAIGLPTICPPHPPDDPELWGSLQGELGNDVHALYRQVGECENKLRAHNLYVGMGWRANALFQTPEGHVMVRQC